MTSRRSCPSWGRSRSLALATTACLVTLAGCPATTSSQRAGSQTEVEMVAGTTAAPPVRGAPAQELPTSEAIAFPAGTAEDVQRYLRTIHKELDRVWTKDVLAMAGAMLPPSHPANQRSRVAEIEVQLDWNGQPAGIRVAQSSGYGPYDESALRAMQAVPVLPPLPPSARDVYPTLYWRFHRDERTCSPALARLAMRALTTEESLRRALARGRFDRAMKILREGGGQPPLLRLVAGVGLDAELPAHRRLALKVASPEQLDLTIVRERDADVWRDTVAELGLRRETARLVAHTTALLRAGTVGRLALLTETLAALDVRPTPTLISSLLAHAEPAVVLAAARLARTPAMLDVALKRWAGKPAVSGPLAVRRFQLGADAGAEKLVRAALADPGGAATAAAIGRLGVATFDEDLQALAKNKRAQLATRVAAITVIGQRRLALVALYLALREDDQPEVQIAAARALAVAKGNKLAISHRLGNLAAGKGRVAVEALAALARVGDERFRFDTVRRLRQLGDARQRALIVGALWGFGEPAVADLTRLLDDSSPAVRAAARASLLRLPGDAARKVLAERGARAGEARAAPGQPLEALLRLAASLAGRTPASGPQAHSGHSGH